MCIRDRPYLGKREMLDCMFKDEAELIEKYCRAELSDRLDRNGVNPGKSCFADTIYCFVPPDISISIR